MEDLICENLSFDNNQHYNEEIAYNANSSITTMKRYGMKDTKGFGLIDNLTFGYNGNQRTKVTDAITEQLTYEGCFDFVDGTNTGNDYTYNANGALTKDQNKGITKIEYDLLGNPKKVTMSNSRSIEYVYAADGRRLRAIHKSGTISEKTDYIGSLILKNGKRQMFRFLGGYYEFGEKVDTIRDCHYYIADYLGNNRMVVNASTDAVEQVNHYYAYGGIIGNLSSNESLQEFKFGDKKLDRTYGLDLYDFEARQYDAIAPWFTSIDPLAEEYYSISPYAYCAGDPVNFGDPTGAFIAVVCDSIQYTYDYNQGAFVDETGNVYHGNNSFMTDLVTQLKQICQGEYGKNFIKQLCDSKKGVSILDRRKYKMYKETANNNETSGIESLVLYGGESTVESGKPYTSFVHELAHAWDRIKGTYDDTNWFELKNGKYVKNAEKYATHIENLVRAEHKLPLRVYYAETNKSYEIHTNSRLVLFGKSLYVDIDGNCRPDYSEQPQGRRFDYNKISK